MNDKLWKIFLFIIWALGMLGTIVYFCYEDQSWVQGLLRLSTSLLTIASLFGYCYIRNIKSKYENADAKTVEKLEKISQQIQILELLHLIIPKCIFCKVWLHLLVIREVTGKQNK